MVGSTKHYINIDTVKIYVYQSHIYSVFLSEFYFHIRWWDFVNKVLNLRVP